MFAMSFDDIGSILDRSPEGRVAKAAEGVGDT
jgi:hypothetical protein